MSLFGQPHNSCLPYWLFGMPGNGKMGIYMTPKKIAKFAGLFYLINIVTGLFTEIFVRSNIIDWENATATAQNIIKYQLLFRAGIISDLIMTTSFLLMGFTFYLLLKQVNKNISLVMLLFNIIGVAILALNLLNQFAPIIILSGADFLKVFSVDQLNALAMLFLTLHKYGYIIAGISWSAYLLPLGYLVYKSEYFPKFLGILLMIAPSYGLTDLFIQFMFPKYLTITYPFIVIAVAAEFSFAFWLLFKKLKDTNH
jgi:hypothetical protein